MAVDVFQYAFVSGEVSPQLYNRYDLEKYDLGVAVAQNWFVDYRGGISTRGGTEFVDYLMNDDQFIKLIPFKFGQQVANTNMLVFGHHYIRFVQDGAYVLEDSTAIDDLDYVDGQLRVHSTAHGLEDGDWVKIWNTGTILDGDTFKVADKTPGTFLVKDTYGNPYEVPEIAPPIFSGDGRVARIYTVHTPYAAEDLEQLQYNQVRDTVRLTHPNFAVRNLQRKGQANWELTVENMDNTIPIPGIVAIFASSSGPASVAFAITVIDKHGQESLPTDHQFEYGIVNYVTTAGQVALKWTPLVVARRYRVYRTRVAQGTSGLLHDSGNNVSISRSFALGFVGETPGAHFVDTNIIPDFTRSPPRENNPFANGRIEFVGITAHGTGYDNDSELVCTDAGDPGADPPLPGGTGFNGYLVIGTDHGDDTGSAVGVVIRNGGRGYINPVFSVSGPGAGATFGGIEISPMSGNDPTVSTIFQQRQIYAGSINKPLVIWGSRPGVLSDFTTGDIILPDDSYEHELDARDVSRIRHLVPARGGLLVMNQTGIWQLTAPQGAPVTPTNALAEPQAYKGVTGIPPLLIDANVLYAEGQGGTVNLLQYNDVAKLYAGMDVSVISNHLFSPTNQIGSWTYADEPSRLVFATRSDGQMLIFTIIREHQVFAWTRAQTKGTFNYVESLQERNVDQIYTIVGRTIGGQARQYLEQFHQRQSGDAVENAWFLDSGLALGAVRGQGTLTVDEAAGNNVDARSDEDAFVGSDVELSFIRAGGGKMKVVEYINPQHVRVQILDRIEDVIWQTDPRKPRPQTFWTIDRQVTKLYGLRHLAGETISALADGNVVHDLVVAEDGSIELPQGSTRAIAGVPYRCVLQNLPPTIQGRPGLVEGKRKRIVGIATRLLETRGLQTGNTLDKLYPMKERMNERWGEPIRLVSGIQAQLLEPVWDENGQTWLVQDEPLPASVLGYVIEVDVGDTELRI